MTTITTGKKNICSAALIAGLLIIALSFCLAGCAAGPSDSSNDQQTTEGAGSEAGTATLVIDTTAVEGGTAESLEVAISEEATAYDVLEKSGISFNAESSQYGMYISGIDGLASGDEGTMSGWLFSINGVAAQASPDKSKVQDGDTITWYFSIDGTMPE